MTATKPTLLVFGIRQPQHPDYAPARFACLYATQGDAANLDRLAAKDRAAGREAYIHAGETVGRDFFPVAPAADLAAAMARAGWVQCHAPLPAERAEAEAAGVAVA